MDNKFEEIGVEEGKREFVIEGVEDLDLDFIKKKKKRIKKVSELLYYFVYELNFFFFYFLW